MSAHADLERALDRLEAKLSGWPKSCVQWVRGHSKGWQRIPLGLALIAGGIFSFLPILGIWMLPLGFVLLARDVPFLATAMARFVGFVAGKIPA